MKDQGFPPRYRGLADLDTQSMGRRMAPSISCERHGCSFWFQLSSTCHCLNMRCQCQLCFQQEGPRGPSWKRERVRTSMWLEHETKPAERERKMTRTQHSCLFVQSAKRRSSQVPAGSSLDTIPSPGSQMFSTSANDGDGSQSRRQGGRGPEHEDGRGCVTRA